MFLIHKKENRISQIEQKSFTELGFKERENLQEWIANNPEALGEELLLIQKEFDGFNDTNERLDLLALDKQGNLVIIENKLDDSGKDVTWQVIKYASYCSSLTKFQIRDIYQNYLDKSSNERKAEDNLSEFFGNVDFKELSLNQGTSQRIMMVAGNFRKEVTSTVLWLLNYKLRIQCFKVTPYSLNDNLLLDIEQIIPMKDAEDYVISMADKTQEDISSQEELKTRYIFRIEFWGKLLKEFNTKSELFSNINPAKDNWIGAGSGISGISFNFVVSHSYARAEIYIQRPTLEECKSVFDDLYKQKAEIEKAFNGDLIWERGEEKKGCRIKYEKQGVDVYDKDDWDKMILFMSDAMARLEVALKEPLKKISAQLKLKNKNY